MRHYVPTFKDQNQLGEHAILKHLRKCKISNLLRDTCIWDDPHCFEELMLPTMFLYSLLNGCLTLDSHIITYEVE